MLPELRWAQIILSLLTMPAWILLMYRHKRYAGYMLAPIWFLLNIIAFNVFRLYGIPVDQHTATVWSIAIRIMGIIATGILGFGILFDIKHNGYNGNTE